MEERKKQFFLLVSRVMELEGLYEMTQEKYNHLVYLENRFGKNNKSEMTSAKHEFETYKKQIDDLIKQISELELDSEMQEYYDLYKEKSEQVKQHWNLQTEIGYISSTFLFDAICDDNIELKLIRKNTDFKKQKKIVDEQIKEIVLKMQEIYSV